jgi:putative phosphonate metabolism protein
MARYAIYYLPERDTALWEFGCNVLGYDAERGVEVTQLVPAGFGEAEWREVTAAPRRYGFHATMKAPIALRDGATEAGLLAAFREFAASEDAFTAEPPKIALHGNYVTLLLSVPDQRVQALGDACVRSLDGFRAPPSEKEKQRRLAGGLSESQSAHLEQWGYPYVFSDFVFHMSLAGPVPEGRSQAAFEGLARLYADEVGDESLVFSSLAIFAEPEPGAPFVVAERAKLRG